MSWLWLWWLACAPAVPPPEPPAAAAAPAIAASPGAAQRVIAVGDVHGDVRAARAALRLAGVVDEAGRWSGGRTIVVQVGDQLDRGDDEREILDWFEQLSAQAAAAGGRFVPLLGNHELMNALGDLRYVTPDGLSDFADFAASGDASVPDAQRGRVAAFKPGGAYALKLASHPVTVLVEGTLFVHGGVLPAHVAYGLDRLDRETAAFLRGEAGLPDVLRTGDAPVWTRLYSDAPDEAACATLAEALKAAGARRMVVAHTVQKSGINAACGGTVWRVDVGLSAHYGGPVQVLELVGDEARVLSLVPPIASP
jgi:hypothetical protein